MRRLLAIVGFLACILVASPAYPCSIVSLGPSMLSTAEYLVVGADWIVRVRATDYASPPQRPDLMTTGVPDSIVRFKVLETVKGADASTEVLIPGYLTDRSDFNDNDAPYQFVRPGGRAGSCFANSYQRGGQFLLFLKRQVTGGYTPNWSALAPVNEQLHSDNDDWITWVRNQVYRDSRTTPDLTPERFEATYAVYSAVLDEMARGRIPLQKKPGREISIVNRTIKPHEKSDELTPQRAREAGVSSDMRLDFIDANALQDPVTSRLKLSYATYHVVSIGQVERFRRDSYSLVGFSRVGFDSSLNQAVVYVYFHCRFDCIEVFYVVLNKAAGGWKSERTIKLWPPRKSLVLGLAAWKRFWTLEAYTVYTSVLCQRPRTNLKF